MSDSINRQDAIDALGEEPEIWNDTEEEWAYRNAWVEHISAIKALPSTDAVEVVRCKDCKWFNDRITCPLNTREKTEGRGFCNRGERREDGEA